MHVAMVMIKCASALCGLPRFQNSRYYAGPVMLIYFAFEKFVDLACRVDYGFAMNLLVQKPPFSMP
jgi:hypothetical protein